MRPSSFVKRAGLLLPLLALGWIAVQASQASFVASLNVSRVASTVPTNGDVNPYGVAVVQRSTGALVKGHILVSNFNNSGNLQGTGTTLMDIAPGGTVKLFAQIDAAKPPKPIDTSSQGAGTLFGLAISRNQRGVYFVDDGDNTLDLLH
jgi:hypothetical protein